MIETKKTITLSNGSILTLVIPSYQAACALKNLLSDEDKRKDSQNILNLTFPCLSKSTYEMIDTNGESLIISITPSLFDLYPETRAVHDEIMTACWEFTIKPFLPPQDSK